MSRFAIPEAIEFQFVMTEQRTVGDPERVEPVVGEVIFLSPRLTVIQGGVTEPLVEYIYRDPVLDQPSFDNNFGVSADPLHPYREIGEDGITTIIPVSERRFF